MIKLILSAPVHEMAEAFKRVFANADNVDVVEKTFEAIPEFDCMVSAANSFGLMDGGVDAAITA
ncbi:phage tail protein, partial [Escherichia albertii]|nr:phage tail protein [Escherichia albertii]